MDYFIHLGILFAIYVILGAGLNLLVGYTGLLSVTHAAFYGIGAYTTAILLTQTGFGFFSSVILGIFVTMITAFLVGIVLSKFKDDYYALASLGFNIIVFSAFLNWQDLTKGPLGIPGISRPELFGFSFSSNISYFVLAILFAGLIYFISKFIINSSFGRVLKAIREDEKAIQVFGYNTQFYKLAIFVISAGMASVAGSLFASYITFIDPSSFYIIESIFILTIIIIGGLANMRGVLLGALFLILLPEALRFVGFPSDIAAQMRQVVYGLILVLLMLYRPKGFLGEYDL
ncbi:TPA: branched-chain amino acid ABC transporter permease [Candidatus Campbellbacteria bacterium]|nr:MAG: inner-membrane translocator, branched-chain amino acid transport system permease protein [Candidatus Campbellbacteria bacterium GW2011_OD1_34_28]KKP75335.1 MAG: Inner-membrane translocator [Candidatus Campbellbacteria bacterium GW2011_GWD2_35_24]KKP76104.1 MAG: inner-membrane translocator, branched-chain amino acid transport system permease protein [Candidatus Campbellbacteria bacterium GW2011_GWC2_35_28]KKP77293.1 MAG: Inner-membrane translocator [Candidatus Campbellbacteria bacterium G